MDTLDVPGGTGHAGAQAGTVPSSRLALLNPYLRLGGLVTLSLFTSNGAVPR